MYKCISHVKSFFWTLYTLMTRLFGLCEHKIALKYTSTVHIKFEIFISKQGVSFFLE